MKPIFRFKLPLETLVFALALASAAGAASPDPAHPHRAVFALVVGNNKSPGLNRRPLLYADDDAAKYFDVLTTLTLPERITVLTEMDEDTARLFPHLASGVQTPTREHLLAAVQRISVAVEASRKRGERPELYFIFAGHGDVDHGRGFLELADSALTSDDLRELLKTVGASRSHVILDSCNSFFVLNPRKPGGRRFATPEDAARQLSEALPNVGVFLATAAEAEVYEWSEIQSGIFSHTVRSGLLGAADADGDGQVTYAELKAFLEIASQEVKNPAFRPKVFASGPGGDSSVALADLRDSKSLVLALDEDGPVRLSLRDGSHLRWLDVHKEAGTKLLLHVPDRLVGELLVDRLAFAPEGVVLTDCYRLATRTGTQTMASLQPVAIDAAPRGPSELLRDLFRAEYGPRALSAFQKREAASPPPVYGISGDDVVRMHSLLEEMSGQARSARLLQGTLLTAAGAGVAGLGTYELAINKPNQRVEGGITAGAGLAAVAGGIYRLAMPSREERILDAFESLRGAQGADIYTLVAKTEVDLEQLAQEARLRRWIQEFAGYTFAAGGAATILAGELSLRGGKHEDALTRTRLYGSTLLGLGLLGGLVSHFIETPTERLLRVWRKDPGIQRLRVDVSVNQGGGILSVGGNF